MNELIKINYESDRPTVLARDLHEFLEVETPFNKWFSRMCEYGFTDGADFQTFCPKVPVVDRQPTHNSQSTWQKKSVCFSATRKASRRDSISCSLKESGTHPKR